MKTKKILFLGASNYFWDAANYVKEQGIYLIAVDSQKLPKAVVKSIADESYDISTIDTEELYKLCIDKDIDGIYAGASEVNIPIAIELCNRLGLYYYTNSKQWEMCTNKAVFKQKCIEAGIPVAKTYAYEDRKIDGKIGYPVVTKPVDNNGSTGISICNNIEELEKGYKKAINNSKSKTILIEEFIPSDSVILQYTVQDGIVKYTGMSDKKSKKIKEDSAPVMAIQFFPSVHEKQYLETINEKAIKMIENAGIKFGAIWIESFYHNKEFVFNEIGFRYGGSLTYYPVEYYYGVNQMNLIIHQALTGKGLYEDFKEINPLEKKHDNLYCILPIQIQPCKISKIEGLDEIYNIDGVYKFVVSHNVNDETPDSGTTLQVFAYLHAVGKTKEDIFRSIKKVKSTLKVLDEAGCNRLFTVWEI
ncbi:MAG: ATP-grasp domain-containing protein [Peptoniphilaceae bacterium]|nr:ATP-grasp domain-containing protein [Peptoniphilaceae bacterium]MDY6018301.1 hypothetical protein [Anaerococcus sp.]